MSPKVDDIGLTLLDELLVNIVTLYFQAFWLGIIITLITTWFHPITNKIWDTRDFLVDPTLIYGYGSSGIIWLEEVDSIKDI